MNEPRRKTNEGRPRIFGDADPNRLIAFVCECGEPDCRRTVTLSATNYDQRRADPILHPAHQSFPL